MVSTLDFHSSNGGSNPPSDTMKFPHTSEPTLRYSINGKKAKRESTKSYRKGYNRSIRRISKNNLEMSNEELKTIFKKRIDYEY